MLGDVLGQALLVLLLGQAEGALELGVVGQRLQLRELVQVPAPAGADAAVDQRRQRRVGLAEPAPRRDAVGLVAEALRERCARSRQRWSRTISSLCSADTPLTLWLASTDR